MLLFIIIEEKEKRNNLILHQQVLKGSTLEAFQAILEERKVKNLEALCERKSSNEENLLHVIAENGLSEIFHFLVSKNLTLKINSKNGDSKTALMLAIEHENLDIARSILEAYGESVELRNGNWSALHVACEKGFYDIVQVLVTMPQVDLTAVDPVSNLTPYMIAKEKNHGEIISLISSDDLFIEELQRNVRGRAQEIEDDDGYEEDSEREEGGAAVFRSVRHHLNEKGHELTDCTQPLNPETDVEEKVESNEDLVQKANVSEIGTANNSIDASGTLPITPPPRNGAVPSAVEEIEESSDNGATVIFFSNFSWVLLLITLFQ